MSTNIDVIDAYGAVKTIHYLPATGGANTANSIPITPATDSTFTLLYSNAISYTVNTAFNAFKYADVEVQVDGSPSGYTVSRSIDGNTYYTDTYSGNNGIISAAGIYRLTGSAYLKIAGGTGATKLTLRAGS